MFLDADKFLNALGKLYEQNKTSGTVYLTLKRSNLKPKPKRKKDGIAADDDIEGESVCLIRATDGKKKISAAIGAKDHMRFQAAYSTLLKAHMDSLKKREREKKRSKPKATSSAVV
mmetsp:Transcript_39801/g.55271  ORF Transcript_39801/g.55271 Transcript_39801/m.55271 type:complete len:116 (+) Transcript_39801:133-480(+)|eukprot:CAMPEP_0196583214 /NCGR_PEP_ID=MMETSP1081-20130531/42537_1 /TAXON_ID=36882 /ORGANISM="Pyramimonas amylifera, Strain CCMP720" /LENGTH=115 /DNA_ID=CAMNT_0041904029 /DNA_START=122 /DNA_END=469 /DNA_ORIENTATION=+